MRKKVVYLFACPVLDSDFERYGFDTLRAAGFEVELFDLSALCYPASRSQPSTRLNNIRCLDKISDFEAAIADSASDSIFVDYISGFSDHTWQNERLFRVLGQYRAPYVVIMGGAVPVAGDGSDSSAKFGNWLRKLPRLMDLRSLGDLIARRVTRALRYKTNIYPKPALVFTPECETSVLFKSRFAIPDHVFVPVNSQDYGRYLRFKRNVSARLVVDQYCVFLDDGLMGHPDIELLNWKKIDPSEYSESLTRFFDRFEQLIGLPVVIAAHPKISYENHNPFGGRKIFYGVTAELVGHSECALAHASTSISFAVLFDKPLQLLVSEAMKNLPNILEGVKRFGIALALDPLNIDSPAEQIRSPKVWPREGFDSFKNKYIVSKQAGERALWETVADRLKNV